MVRGEFLAPVCLSNDKLRYGYIDAAGNTIIPASFTFACPFSDGLAAVCTDGEHWGYIDRTGSFIVPATISVVGERPGFFSEGRAAILEVLQWQRQWGYIDRQGQKVIPAQFSEAQPFHSGYALVRIKSDQFLIDKQGRPVWPKPQADAKILDGFSEGLTPATAATREGMKIGYIDSSLSFVIKPQFVKYQVNNSLTPAQTPDYSDEPFAYSKIQMLVNRIPDRLPWSFSEGLAALRLPPNGSFGYIDRRGRIVIPAQFQEANPFCGGLAEVVLEDHRPAYINRSGTTVWIGRVRSTDVLFRGGSDSK